MLNGCDVLLLRSVFEWRAPTTYLFAFTTQFLFTAYVCINGSALMSHSFASVWLFMAIVDDIKIDMSALDAHNGNKTSDARLYEYLCEFIKFHTEIKQFSYWLLFDSMSMMICGDENKRGNARSDEQM